MITSPTRTFELDSLSELELHQVAAEVVNYRDRHALRLVEQDEPTTDDHAIAGVYESYADLVPGPGRRSKLLRRASERNCMSIAQSSPAWWCPI